MRVAIDLFTVCWWFFAATALQGLIVALAWPDLLGTSRPGAWTAMTTVSTLGAVAALVFTAGMRRSMTRARTMADPSVNGERMAR